MSDYNKAVSAMGRLNDLMGEHVPEHARTDRAADDIWTMFSIIEDHKRKSEELTSARDEAERLMVRVAELESMKPKIVSIDDNPCYIFRKQAEALEVEAREWGEGEQCHSGRKPHKELTASAQRLRQQADDLNNV